jgi:hypothetical protein
MPFLLETRRSYATLCTLLLLSTAALAATPRMAVVSPAVVQPLTPVTVTAIDAARVQVRDGAGHVYWQTPAASEVTFLAGGALGRQTFEALDSAGRVVATVEFTLAAESAIADRGGRFSELFDMARGAMSAANDGVTGTGSVEWRGKRYRYFVPWILDHSHTTKGMQYFSPYAGGMVDLFAAAQRPDGMIWSFVGYEENQRGYYLSAYGPYGYAKLDSGTLFVRQPVENHNESNFVDALYLAWRGSGDDAWMTSHLDAAKKALDYSVTDPARFSARFQLLKRAYTIDSWDFQPRDKYLVPFRFGIGQTIDPARTKFTIFFGDNTAYAHACGQFAAMLTRAGYPTEANKYSERARQIRARLDALAWNGRFYNHHIEEDPTVVRDYGVPETGQFAMSNAYSLNRGVTDAQAAAIVASYRHLRDHLPPGSPGEWYSVYPPYDRGFDADNGRWQYMNAGVHLHAAGELARGALERGFESYGADILERVAALGKAHGNKLYFAYTGASTPPPPAPDFTPVDLAKAANMDLTGQGAPGVHGWFGNTDGNDMRNLPTGAQRFGDAPFRIIDPAANGRRAAVVVSAPLGSPRVEIPIHAMAPALHLVHVVDGAGPSGVAVALRFEYEDGSARSLYLMSGKQLASAWWPHLKAGDAGVAWRGANSLCADCGVFWAAVANPEPAKPIARLVFTASDEGASYALIALTLASRMPYHEPSAVSFGGPDNWSAALVMYALVEGLAGIRDTDVAYRAVELSPRWTAAGVSEISVTARYAASQGYVSYRFRHHAARRTISVNATGNAEVARLRILLPAAAKSIAGITLDGRPQPIQSERVRDSLYAVVPVTLTAPVTVEVHYDN